MCRKHEYMIQFIVSCSISIKLADPMLGVSETILSSCNALGKCGSCSKKSRADARRITRGRPATGPDEKHQIHQLVAGFKQGYGLVKSRLLDKPAIYNLRLCLVQPVEFDQFCFRLSARARRRRTKRAGVWSVLLAN